MLRIITHCNRPFNRYDRRILMQSVAKGLFRVHSACRSTTTRNFTSDDTVCARPDPLIISGSPFRAVHDLLGCPRCTCSHPAATPRPRARRAA